MDKILIDSQVKHFVYLQRLGAHHANNAAKKINKLSGEIKKQIPAGLNKLSKRELNELLRQINNLQKNAHDKILSEYRESIDEIAVHEAEREESVINSVINTEDFTAEKITAAAVLLAIRDAPMSVGQNGSGVLPELLLKNWEQRQREIIGGTIRQGWFEGRESGVIIEQLEEAARVVGVLAFNAISRSLINHISQIARAEVWKKNSGLAKGWKFVAVLDSITGKICINLHSLDAIYKIGFGPYPPRHVNCRSTSVIVIKDEFMKTKPIRQVAIGSDGVKRTTAKTYYDWIKTQPKYFVEDVLGKTRARLLLSGKLSSKLFAQLSLDRNFQPLTLAEMKQRDKYDLDFDG